MSVLADHEIDQLLGAAAPLAVAVPRNDFTGATSRIQAASLDLTIGDIYVPGTDPDVPGGLNSPRTSLSLEVGHTAVVRTAETVSVPSTLVAIGFPPSSLSTKGILMTNPGQVDPGYVGTLHLTIINMGKEAFDLSSGNRVIRLLFLQLNAPPTADYAARHPGAAAPVITDELLRKKLSEDFVNVQERAEKVAKDLIVKAGVWTAIAVAVITGGFAFVGNVLQTSTKNATALETRLQKIEKDIGTNETNIKLLGGTADLTKLKTQTEQLDAEIKRTEVASEAAIKTATDAATKAAIDAVHSAMSSQSRSSGRNATNPKSKGSNPTGKHG